MTTVKHFRFEERGKRRIHQTPTARQITACRPWVRAELRVVKPEALVVMGAVAAKTLLGNAFKVTSSAAACSTATSRRSWWRLCIRR